MSTVVSDERPPTEFDYVIRSVRHHKLVVAIGVAIGVGIAVWLALTLPPVFRAETIVAQVRDRAAFGAGLSPEMSALTSLVGLNLNQANNIGEEADGVLDSRRLVEEFIQRQDLLPILSQKSPKPLSMWRAVTTFKEGILSIRKDTRRGMTTVGIVWTDPVAAARWANQIVALANELIRTRAVSDATRDIAYLNRQIEQTNAVELRQALYDMVKSETKTLMLANGRSEFAFEVVDPAVAPEIKIGPHRSIIGLLGLGGGFILGTSIAMLLERRRRSGGQLVHPAAIATGSRA